MMRIAIGAMAALAVLGCASGGSGASSPQDGGLRPLVVGGGNNPMDPKGGGGGRDVPHTLYTTADIGEQAVLPAPIDSAYTSIVLAYRSLGIDIKTSDPAQHLVGNRHIVIMHTWLGSRPSSFFSCGNDATGIPRADSYQLVISVVSSLSPKDATHSTMLTLATAQANDVASTASSVYCPSTGRLEMMLLKAAGYAQN
jgi:hypothetical protein